jgi:hypothetical protein
MTEFDDRERAAEKKFERDQELEFKAHARRNRLLGLWAAGEMGLKGAEADSYAKTVVEADLTQAGDEDVFQKIRADFDAKKINVSDHLIRAHMAEYLNMARIQIQSGV